MYRLIFSLFFLTIITDLQAQEKKNQIGLELLKPMYSILHSQIANSTSEFKGFNIEVSYSRVLLPFISYRATAGAVKYGLENEIRNYQYRSEGWFLKHGLDFFPQGEEKQFNLLFGLSAIFSKNQEKQRGFFEGNYYPTYYTPYIKRSEWVLGGELALRFRWLIGKYMAIEFSPKIAFRGSYRSNGLFKRYVPGMGPMMSSQEIPFNAISFPGIDLKYYFRF